MFVSPTIYIYEAQDKVFPQLPTSSAQLSAWWLCEDEWIYPSSYHHAAAAAKSF